MSVVHGPPQAVAKREAEKRARGVRALPEAIAATAVTASRFSPAWIRERLLENGGLDPESIAGYLSYLGMGDIRAAFFSVAEFAAAFRVSRVVAARFLRNSKLRLVTIGRHQYVTKPELLAHVLSGDWRQP